MRVRRRNAGFVERGEAVMENDAAVAFEFTDRYKALCVPYPDPETMCPGDCEGIGFYPLSRFPTPRLKSRVAAWKLAHAKRCSINGRLKSLWKAVTRLDRIYLSMAMTRCDGWHFVRCEVCGGTGKRVGGE